MRLALTIIVVLLVASPAGAQDAGSRYSAAYRATGFRLRATYVCPGNKRAMTDHAFAPVASPEFKAFSQAYPETIKKWMGEGAGMFNDIVMQSGLNEACRRAT